MRPPAPLRLELPGQRRRRPWAFGLALVLHLALLAFLASDAGRAWVRALAPGPVAVPERAAGGGGGGGRERSVAYISLPADPAPRPVVPPKIPVVPRPEPAAAVPPPVVPPAVDTTSVATAPAPSAPADSVGTGGTGGRPGAGGQGGGTGAGTGPGTGPGVGGAVGQGSAPEPRQLVLPPADYPRDMRGRRVDVTFFVAADGRVERIAIDPEIRDGGFARKFEEAMRNYRFRPARSPEGTPVPGTTTVTVFF
jgi:protein TonB